MTIETCFKSNLGTKIAMVFPGQGSQTVGMLKDLACKENIITSVYAEASEVLNYDLWKLVHEGPVEQLNQTEFTQPALLAAEIGMWRVWKDKKLKLPDFLAGHSLGEYSALVAAEAIEFATAIQLVAMRGRLMQQAIEIGKGAMVALVGLDEAAIQTVCEQARENQVLMPANYNSIGQTVLAGEKAAAERAVLLAKQAGAKVAKLLDVSVPSHCKLMQPMAEKFAVYLEQINIDSPTIPVVSNVDVAIYKDATDIRDGLVRQLFNPVHWVGTIQMFTKQKVDCIVECGPGKILTGLNKRIADNIQYLQAEQLLLGD